MHACQPIHGSPGKDHEVSEIHRVASHRSEQRLVNQVKETESESFGSAPALGHDGAKLVLLKV
jgi:hypothetical protein